MESGAPLRLPLPGEKQESAEKLRRRARMDGHRSLPSEVSIVSALGKRSYSGVAVVVKMGLKWLLQPTSPLLLRYETLD